MLQIFTKLSAILRCDGFLTIPQKTQKILGFLSTSVPLMQIHSLHAWTMIIKVLSILVQKDWIYF